MREVFAEHQPEVVFHAAAYKHVALMEDNPIEAVRNNALATRALTDDRRRVRDRARSCSSRPTRRSLPRRSWARRRRSPSGPSRRPTRAIADTAFCAVRFGNVLGSSGSVVPIFRRQIAAGGPVTVTDPEMTRFFMTIPEAVQLVIRSGSLAQGGEVFALEMGEPVRIMDLAEADDPVLGPGARPRHRDRDHRPPPGREAARAALQRLRARRADARAEDHARGAARPSIRPGSSTCSTRSGCSSPRATRPVWPPRWRSLQVVGRRWSKPPRSRPAAPAS